MSTFTRADGPRLRERENTHTHAETALFVVGTFVEGAHAPLAVG